MGTTCSTTRRAGKCHIATQANTADSSLGGFLYEKSAKRPDGGLQIWGRRWQPHPATMPCIASKIHHRHLRKKASWSMLCLNRIATSYSGSAIKALRRSKNMRHVCIAGHDKRMCDGFTFGQDFRKRSFGNFVAESMLRRPPWDRRQTSERRSRINTIC